MALPRCLDVKLRAGAQILGCTKALRRWGDAADAPTSLHDLITCDPSIIKVGPPCHAARARPGPPAAAGPGVCCTLQAVIGLSGMVAIAAEGVGTYVEAFNAFAFLWQRDLASEYAKFMATHPQLEARPAPTLYPPCAIPSYELM